MFLTNRPEKILPCFGQEVWNIAVQNAYLYTYVYTLQDTPHTLSTETRNGTE